MMSINRYKYRDNKIKGFYGLYSILIFHSCCPFSIKSYVLGLHFINLKNFLVTQLNVSRKLANVVKNFLLSDSIFISLLYVYLIRLWTVHVEYFILCQMYCPRINIYKFLGKKFVILRKTTKRNYE